MILAQEPSLGADAGPGTAGSLRTHPSDDHAATAGPRPTVVFHCIDPCREGGHDHRTKASVAHALADLLGLPFGGFYRADAPPQGPLFFVPSETLTSVQAARQLGIEDGAQLFGGVVPHDFVATKLVSHGLVNAQATAPAGWQPAHGEAVQAVTLPGYAVFSAPDALLAAERLLAHGSLRLKKPDGVGGLGQQVMRHIDELRLWLDETDPEVLRQHGVVLERNLRQVETLSVGQVQAGPLTASYVGTQQLTTNHRGEEVYGGSTLTVVRGGFDALRAMRLSPEMATAVDQALVYHQEAARHYPGFLATRANYDVAQGIDDRGQWRSGVLEQSWRIGGASGAEVAALQHFQADPACRAVRASTHEVYGDQVPVPAGARVHYDDDDAEVGRVTKYAQVEAHADL